MLGVDSGGEAGAVTGDGAFDGVGEVVPQMPPVRHLHRVGGAGPGAFGVGTGSIPADDFDTGMISEPRGQGRGAAIGQHVDGPAGLDVDQHGCVVVSTAQREVVDTEHSCGRCLCVR